MRVVLIVAGLAISAAGLPAAARADCPLGANAYRVSASSPAFAVERVADNAMIPDDPANRDWACYQAWLAAGNTPAPATPASIAEQYSAKIAAGLSVTFTSAPALNGTYSIGPVSKQNLSAIYAGIRGGDGLPGGGSTFYYRDQAGAPHAFTADQIAALAKAVRDYLYQLDLASGSPGGPTWPASSVTIPPIGGSSGGEALP